MCTFRNWILFHLLYGRNKLKPFRIPEDSGDCNLDSSTPNTIVPPHYILHTTHKWEMNEILKTLPTQEKQMQKENMSISVLSFAWEHEWQLIAAIKHNNAFVYYVFESNGCNIYHTVRLLWICWLSNLEIVCKPSNKLKL